MRFINLLVLWLTATIQANCQQLITGSVVSRDGKSVRYATLLNQSKTHGISADSVGRFSFLLRQGEDTVLVSATGYKTATYPIHKSPNTIILEEDTVQLAVVAVRRLKGTVALYGNTNKKVGGSHKNCSATNLEISIQLPPCSGANSYAQKLLMYVTKEGHYEAPFRIHFYSDKQGLPGQELTTSPVINTAFRPGAWTVIDLAAAQIRLPDEQPYHASIEWLYSDDPAIQSMFSEGKCFGIALGVNQFGKSVLASTRINGGQWSACNHYQRPDGVVYNPMIQVITESYH